MNEKAVREIVDYWIPSLTGCLSIEEPTGTVTFLEGQEVTPNCTINADGSCEIEVGQGSTEYVIAHELGHVALAKKHDICFATWRSHEVSSEAVDRFMGEVRTALNCVCDVFVDDLLFKISPAMVTNEVFENIEEVVALLLHIDERGGSVIDRGPMQLPLYVAFSFADIPRYNMSDCYDLPPVEKAVRSFSYSRREATVRLYELIEKMPPLPDDRQKAVRAFEVYTQRVCEIVGFPIPALIYDDTTDAYLVGEVKHSQLP